MLHMTLLSWRLLVFRYEDLMMTRARAIQVKQPTDKITPQSLNSGLLLFSGRNSRYPRNSVDEASCRLDEGHLSVVHSAP